jgi:hypothetical protein
MRIWDRIRRSGQRQAGADPLAQIEVDGAVPLVPDEHYFRVSLAQMHLATESTLWADWVPGAHVAVSYSRQNAPLAEYSRVLRPDPERLAQGARLNFPITDLVPYRGGVLEIEAALFGLQAGNRLDLVVDVLQVVSGLGLPAVGAALQVAGQITTATRDLVAAGDGVVHLNMHQSYVAANGVGTGNVLRPMYVAALLSDNDQLATGSLTVVGDQLHVDGPTGPEPLLGRDFLLLKIEARPDRDDFWLPELELFLSKAITALRHGDKSRAEDYRQDAVAAVWDTPTLTWVDRERVVAAVRERFAAVADSGLGATGAAAPSSVRELV